MIVFWAQKEGLRHWGPAQTGTIDARLLQGETGWMETKHVES